MTFTLKQYALYGPLLLKNPQIKLMINRIIKIQNRILAMLIAPAAIPPNPKTAAITATIKKTSAHQSIHDLLKVKFNRLF